MCLEETRVLSNDVHDVGRNDGFIVFSSFHFAKAQKVFDDDDKKALLSIFVCEIVNR
jgi:hypothetical protein